MASSAVATTDRDPFCMKDVIRKQSVHDGSHFTALYNSKALTEGHSLIVTHRHIMGLLDLKAAEVKELFDMIGTVLPVILDTYAEGGRAYDLKIRSGDASGRTVNHFHVHLIPRKLVQAEDGGTEHERIYSKSLENLNRPFLDDIENDLRMLRRGLSKQVLATRTPPEVGNHPELGAELRANVFYESKHFVALFHPKPVIEGQTLLIPKRDVSDFLELSDEERRDFARIYAKIMNLLIKVYGDETRSYITSMQTGGYGNMPIDRLHINLIPRSKSDRYAGRDDDMYYDIYESPNLAVVMNADEIKSAVESLRRLVQA